MSGRKGQRRHRNADNFVGKHAKEVLTNIHDDSKIMEIFRSCAVELDDKHDRHERIVKISRDITIESKRIIFLLHNTATEIEEKREKTFEEAESRLHQLLNKFKLIAIELEGLDHYLYLRAYSAGLEEYVEAYTFYEYQRYGEMSTVKEFCSKFVFPIKVDDESEEMKEIVLLCPPVDILLGIGDFTGEMMRKCINNLGSGNIESCFKLCSFVRQVYVGFLSLNISGHSAACRKFSTLKGSLSKMELVCYNIKVRGSEVPKHMLSLTWTSPPEDVDDDEGFY